MCENWKRLCAKRNVYWQTHCTVVKLMIISHSVMWQIFFTYFFFIITSWVNNCQEWKTLFFLNLFSILATECFQECSPGRGRGVVWLLHSVDNLTTLNSTLKTETKKKLNKQIQIMRQMWMLKTNVWTVEKKGAGWSVY